MPVSPEKNANLTVDTGKRLISLDTDEATKVVVSLLSEIAFSKLKDPENDDHKSILYSNVSSLLHNFMTSTDELVSSIRGTRSDNPMLIYLPPMGQCPEVHISYGSRGGDDEEDGGQAYVIQMCRNGVILAWTSLDEGEYRDFVNNLLQVRQDAQKIHRPGHA